MLTLIWRMVRMKAIPRRHSHFFQIYSSRYRRRTPGLILLIATKLGPGGEGWLRFPDLIWSKTLMELIFNPSGEVRRTQLAKSTLLTSTWGPLGSFQMLKRESGMRKATESYRTYFSLVGPKTATLVAEFAVEDLPLNRPATLVPAFAVKDLPLGRTLWWWWSWVLGPRMVIVIPDPFYTT